MADFVAVLKKTLKSIGDNTSAMHARVYDKARSAISAKLDVLNLRPPAAGAERQTKSRTSKRNSTQSLWTTIRWPSWKMSSLRSLAIRTSRPAAGSAPELKVRSLVMTSAPPHAAASMPAYIPKQLQPPIDFSARQDDKGPEAEGDNCFDATDDGYPFANTKHKPSKRVSGGLIGAALAMVVVGAGGYALRLNRDAFLDNGNNTVTKTTPPANETATSPIENGGNSEPRKFTQRMTAAGKEVDPGPETGTNGVDENISVAALNQPASATLPASPELAPETQATLAKPTEDTSATTLQEAGENAPLAAGQKAIFYEERTNVAQGSVEQGSVVWTLVQESPGGDLPLESAIHAEVTIPGKDIQLRMTVRRNADKTLPASHILEMIFLTPDGFDGGGIENILRVAMKNSEQDVGDSLLGISAKIATGFFLVALNDTKAEVDANLNLLSRQSWIDVPVVYKSSRRALFTLEKGISGDKVFEEAMKAWQAKEAS